MSSLTEEEIYQLRRYGKWRPAEEWKEVCDKFSCAPVRNYARAVAHPDVTCFKCGEDSLSCYCWLCGIDESLIEKERKADEEMASYYAQRLQITEEVRYIGEGDDPSKDTFFNIWKKCLKELKTANNDDKSPRLP